jgi:hypothetical protein
VNVRQQKCQDASVLRSPLVACLIQASPKIQTSFTRCKSIPAARCSGEKLPVRPWRSRCEHQRIQQMQNDGVGISQREAHRSHYAIDTSLTRPHIPGPHYSRCGVTTERAGTSHISSKPARNTPYCVWRCNSIHSRWLLTRLLLHVGNKLVHGKRQFYG